MSYYGYFDAGYGYGNPVVPVKENNYSNFILILVLFILLLIIGAYFVL
ncbi:YjcZ family sporulation protein [Halalkalibacter wakoensis]|nr:YjcZ family sporulation protein [Halalkalibacter wakoensis]